MSTRGLQLEASLGRVAADQYGLITAAQAADLGFSPEALRRRVRAGTLIRAEPGVFRVVGAPRSWQQRAMAASLWLAGRGALARKTAAALHRLDGFPPPVVIEAATSSNLKASHRLTSVKRTPFMLDVDATQIARITVTSIERTLIDVAAGVGEAPLEVAIEDALRRRLTSVDLILRRLADLPANQAGRRTLMRALEARGGQPPADSALEVKLSRLLREEGFPSPIRQKVLDDQGRFVGRVDFVYPERRLIIEADGFRFHSGRAAFDADRSRRNSLTALGWVVMHTTAPMLHGPDRAEFLRHLWRAYRRPL